MALFQMFAITFCIASRTVLKDGYVYPLDRETSDKSRDIMSRAVRKAILGLEK
jgi:hypothetical protein